MLKNSPRLLMPLLCAAAVGFSALIQLPSALAATAKSKPGSSGATKVSSSRRSPAPKNSAKSASAAEKESKKSLADFLATELGSGKFHQRKEWAGKSGAYAPNPRPSYAWKPMGTVRYLTIHHAAGVPLEHPAEMIRNIYVGQTARRGPVGGAADVAYHFLVDRNGEVWEARSANIMGSHVGSTPRGLNNAGNIGICGLGSFADRTPSKAMCDGIVRLSEALSRYYGRPLTVRGHRDWAGINKFGINERTECPGKLEQVVPAIQKKLAAIQPEKRIEVAGKVGKK